MDSAAFTQLLRRHARLLHKVAYAYCREQADREDVVQEIALELWHARARYDPRFRETTWIYRIAINVAISWFRRQRRHREPRVAIEDALLAVAPVVIDPDLERLLRALDELGALDRALVILYLDGNDHATIGDVLGLSTSNVGTKLARIKDKLRATLGVDSAKEHTDGPR